MIFIASMMHSVSPTATVWPTVTNGEESGVGARGVVTYTPDPDYNGDDEFTYEACDPGGSCDGATVSVEVISVNDAPSFAATDPPQVRAGGGPQVITGWATFRAGPDDESGQIVTFEVTDVADPGVFADLPSIDPAGTLRFTPGSRPGSSSFTVTAHDDGGTAGGGQDTSASRTFEVTIFEDRVGPAVPPVARPDARTTEVNTPIVIDVVANDSDPEGDILSIRDVSTAGNGDVRRLTGRTVSYLPDRNFYGTDTFTYRVCAPGDRCSLPTTVTIDVTLPPARAVDVAAEISATPRSVGVGQLVSVRVTLTNDGPAAATGVEVALTIPGALGVVDGPYLGPQGTAPWSGTIERLDPGASAVVRFLAEPRNPGAQEVAVEVVALGEPDVDSVPADGAGDDRASAIVEVGDAPGVAGFVFVDEDNDGELDPGEGPPAGWEGIGIDVAHSILPGQQVSAGSAGAGALLLPVSRPAAGVHAGLAGGSGIGVQALQPAAQAGGECEQPRRSLRSDGGYSADCGIGQYEITFDVAAAQRLGYTLRSPDDARPIFYVLGVGEGRRKDFALRVQESFAQSIVGKVEVETADGSVTGRGGVTVVATSETDSSLRTVVETDGSGTYRFELPPGNYDVAPVVPEGLRLVAPLPGSTLVELGPGEDIVGVDFTLRAPELPGSTITGIVWRDDNRNGTLDMTADGEPAEPVIGGVEVTLSRGGVVVGVQESTALGGFEFVGLEAGAYTVTVDGGEILVDLAPITPTIREVAVVPASNEANFVEFGFVPVEGGAKGGTPFPWLVVVLVLLGVFALVWLLLWAFRPPPRSVAYPVLTLPDEPYPGPRPFHGSEAHKFFGRDDEIRRLVAMTYANRVTVLFGPSGAGKTSLLRAGYIPALDPKDFEILPVVRFEAGQHTRGAQAGNHFVARALATWTPAGQRPPSVETTFAEFFGDRPHLVNALGEPLARVLVFDEFEELFAPYPERWQQRHDFFGQMEELLRGDGLDRIVISIRDEELGALAPLLDHLDLQTRAELRLERLGDAPAVAALVGPLATTDVRFGEGVAEEVVSELRRIPADRRARRAEGESEFIDPIRLQLVALASWRSRDGTTLIRHDLVPGWADSGAALRAFYEGAVRQVASIVDEDVLRQWIEGELITSSGAPAAVEGARAAAAVPLEALTGLEQAGLLVRVEGTGPLHMALAHERFVPEILISNDEHRESRLRDVSARLLSRAAQTWEEHRRREVYLLRGAELADVAALARDHPDLVTGPEREYIDASLAADRPVS